MSNKTKTLVLVGLLVLGLSLWLQFERQGPRSPSENRKEMQKKTYICPMHPQVTSDGPGSCPICGMDLVPAEDLEDDEDFDEDHKGHDHHQSAGEGAEAKAPRPHSVAPAGRSKIKVSQEAQQRIGVKVATVKHKELFKSIRVPGRVAFDPDLYTAQSEYLEALRQWKRVKDSPIAEVRENAKQMIHSSRIRLRVLGLSSSQIEALGKKGFQSEGLLVGGQDNLVYADVFEVDLPAIREGQAASISANFLQGKSISGKVTSVDQVIDPNTRTAKVRIQLSRSEMSIRPESYVNVEIKAPVGEHLAVPLDAILDTGLDTFVFIKKGEGRFEPISVVVLLETDREAAVGGTIQAGDKVVLGANFLLDSESRLKNVLQGSSSSGHNH